MKHGPEGKVGDVPLFVIWMAVLLPYSFATFVALACAAALVAVIGYGHNFLPRQTVDSILVVLFSGIAVVYLAFVAMHWTVHTHLSRIRKQVGAVQDKEMRPLATWWKSAGWMSRLCGALGIVALLLGVGLIKSSAFSMVGVSLVVCGVVLLIVTRLLAARSGARR